AWQVRGEGIIAMSPDGAWLAGADPKGEAIVVRAVRDGREHRRWPLTARAPDEKIVGVTWAPGGARFAIATSAARVATLAIDEPTLTLATAHGEAAITCLAWSPSGTLLATSDDRGTTLVRAPGAAPTSLADGATPISAC